MSQTNQGKEIHPKVEVNDKINQDLVDVTPAEDMESEERDLVVENSVDDTLTYAEKPLSDAEIRRRSLDEEEIKPEAED